jgi:hypothetical protein
MATLHGAGKTRANSLIDRGKVNKTSSWSFSASDGNALLGESGDDWDNYGKHHLGTQSGTDAMTKAHWKYPFAKKSGGEVKLYRRALIAIRSRSAANGDDTIFDAAGSLLGKIDGKSLNLENSSEAQRSLQKILAMLEDIRLTLDETVSIDKSY